MDSYARLGAIDARPIQKLFHVNSSGVRTAVEDF
jgi:hypothetical protein